MSITVYSKPRCVQCDATYRAFDKAGVDYTVVDLTQDAAALDMVRELGYSQAPVVMAGDEHWAGFRPDRIKVAVAAVQAAATPAATLAAI
ncbi:glutaredoxin-like protein NrdH [Buchananella felis]|uniref:glutaredoxin-like protein NrdH n=1 Tax=Buchananella felis TaxID=3231492 RepID=UPI003528400B